MCFSMDDSILLWCDVDFVDRIFSSVMVDQPYCFFFDSIRFMDLLTMVFSVLTFYGSEHIYIHRLLLMWLIFDVFQAIKLCYKPLHALLSWLSVNNNGVTTLLPRNTMPQCILAAGGVLLCTQHSLFVLCTCLFLTDLIEILYFMLMHTKDLTIFQVRVLFSAFIVVW